MQSLRFARAARSDLFAGGTGRAPQGQQTLWLLLPHGPFAVNTVITSPARPSKNLRATLTNLRWYRIAWQEGLLPCSNARAEARGRGASAGKDGRARGCGEPSARLKTVRPSCHAQITVERMACGRAEGPRGVAALPKRALPRAGAWGGVSFSSSASASWDY